MNRLRPLAPLLVALLASCQTSPSMDAQTSHPARPADPGIGQAMDPDTGQVYYVVCDPCLKPTPKTRPLPAVATPAAPAVTVPPPVDAVPPAVPERTPSAAGMEAPAPIPAQAQTPLADPAAQSAPAAAPAPVAHCVPFASARATFGPMGLKSLAALVPEAMSAESIHIRAYTSRRPGMHSGPEANEALAMARAEAIRQHLVQAGVVPALISTSHCTDCFIESNDTLAGQLANRQAIVVLGAADPVDPAEIDRKRQCACRHGKSEACNK